MSNTQHDILTSPLTCGVIAFWYPSIVLEFHSKNCGFLRVFLLPLFLSGNLPFPTALAKSLAQMIAHRMFIW